MDSPRDPSLETVLELAADLLRDQIHVTLPGKILDYDAAKQSATVQPLVKTREFAEDGETIVARDMPPIHDVPVSFVGPARGRMTWPVAAGDICEVRFSGASIARWCAMPAGATIDPGDPRRHDPSDAICMVGLHSPASPPTDAPTDAVVIHVSGGVAIKLGSSSSSESGLLGDSFVSACDSFADAISTFAATCTTTPSTGPATALATAVAAFKSAIAAAKSGTVKLS